MTWEHLYTYLAYLRQQFAGDQYDTQRRQCDLLQLFLLRWYSVLVDQYGNLTHEGLACIHVETWRGQDVYEHIARIARQQFCNTSNGRL